MFMFTLFMLMLKDDLFCLLKKLVLFLVFCSQVKIPLIFFWVVMVVVVVVVVYIFDMPKGGGVQ